MSDELGEEDLGIDGSLPSNRCLSSYSEPQSEESIPPENRTDENNVKKVRVYVSEIIRQIQESAIPEGDKATLIRYLTSVVNMADNPVKAAQAYDAINFIVRQLNPDTFESTINFGQFNQLTNKAARSLFKLIVLGYMNEKDVSFISSQALYWSTYSFMMMLFMKVLNAQHGKYKIELTKAQNSPTIPMVK